MAGHRYWRLAFTSGAGAEYLLAEVQFRTAAGTALLFSGGTPSASSTYSGYPAGNACDNNAATDFYTAAGAGAGQWWQYDYGPGNTPSIVEVTITTSSDAYSNYAPSTLSLQYSDDGATFTTLQAFTAAAWTSGATQTFTVPTTLTATKANAYAVLGPQAMTVGKTTGYALLGPPSLMATKALGYAVLAPIPRVRVPNICINT
ncbi:MAG: discoidin domain-containing protein [Acetobacteraceae bacterium]|nr:discoidin domain-containing protein [Acetobacteraceae bacterium]